METKSNNNYFNWVWHELRSLNAAGAIMLAFIVGVQLAFYLSAPITILSTITLLATLVGSACTVFMAIGKPINGLLGLISAIGFIYINWTAGHYASVLDQLVFVALIDLPLIFTWKTWGHKVENGVKFIDKTGWALTLGFILAAWYPMMKVYATLGDTNPIWDSIVLIIGATASLYVFKGYGDSYSLWLLSDAVNIALWVSALFAGYSASSLPMLLTMSFYLATAVYGRFWSIWKGNK